MCSSRGIYGDNNRPNRSSNSEGTRSRIHYALCALAVGLIALGIGTIVAIMTKGFGHEGYKVAAGIMIGVGAAMLVLSIVLMRRSKRRQRNARNQPVATGVPLMNHAAGEQEGAAADQPTYSVPSYDEVVGSDNYPVRQSNLRQSTSQLPSYEDITVAVENEGTEPADDPTEDTPLNDSTPAPGEAAADPPGLTSQPSLPSLPNRSTSWASRLLRPLRSKRIKSDKLHRKDFRLQIRSRTQNPVTIEPITPPPQYDNEMPELG